MAKGGFRGGMPNSGMAKQVQKMQEEFKRMQAELEATEFTATVGGGVVTATMVGTRQLKSVEIKPEAVDPDDVEMLQDLIVAAVNEAITKADDATNAAMSRITPMSLF